LLASATVVALPEPAATGFAEGVVVGAEAPEPAAFAGSLPWHPTIKSAVDRI
jgi:hypothetical protein